MKPISANRSRNSSTRTIGVPGFTIAAPGAPNSTVDGGPRVRIPLPPAVSPVRTTGSGATFAMGRVARREMILRSKRYPGVDRVVCSMGLDADWTRPDINVYFVKLPNRDHSHLRHRRHP